MQRSENLKNLSDAVSETHRNLPIAQINDHCIRLAVNVDQTYKWHFHPDSEEFFLVLEGQLIIEFRDAESVVLNSGDLFTVQKGKIHRTIAHGRTVNLCFETSRASTIFCEEIQ